jgi:hypothetical protein
MVKGEEGSLGGAHRAYSTLGIELRSSSELDRRNVEGRNGRGDGFLSKT